MKFVCFDIASRKFLIVGFILLSCYASHLSSATCSDNSSSVKPDNDVEFEVTSPSNFIPDPDWLNTIRSTEQKVFDTFKRVISCREDLSCAVSFDVENGHFNNIHLAKGSGNQSVDTFSLATVQYLENGQIFSQSRNFPTTKLVMVARFRFRKTVHFLLAK